MTSSVAPSDSASAAGGKKNRPGKNARKAKQASSASSVTRTSASEFFASQAPVGPIPQPGMYPVVFQTGIGEPTRDTEFQYSARNLNQLTYQLSDKYTYNPRYAEFSNHSGYTDDLFDRDLKRMFLLGLAQQTVHSHINMQLPMGDFSSISSTDLPVPTALSSVIREFGEFQQPGLGTRYLLCDYTTTVSSLVHTASELTGDNPKDQRVIRRNWLPMKGKDKRTTFIIGKALAEFIANGLGVRLSLSELTNYLFDSRWDAFDNLKPLLGDTDDRRDRFDFLFSGYGTELQFTQKFTGPGPGGVLSELGLEWHNPDVSHMNFSFLAKVTFPELVDDIARKKSALTKFISCTTMLSNRLAASGSAAQLSSVSTDNGVTVVKTRTALSAPELSLLACFPPSCFVDEGDPYNVVVTTSIAVSTRATEFLQLDWIG